MSDTPRQKILIVDDVGESARIVRIVATCKEQDLEAVVLPATAVPQDHPDFKASVGVLRASTVPVATPMARIRKRPHYRREGFANMMGRLQGTIPERARY